jgi:hypothetical protein
MLIFVPFEEAPIKYGCFTVHFLAYGISNEFGYVHVSAKGEKLV